ncbi:MAG: 4Fe-4S dicluster domain-containing protein [Nitrospiraceae bacterium]|nr:4Fe-4S dicluster domain-containing protein [Nitrospiraceae bacterium]
MKRIEVDLERCKGCCLCIEACPDDLIEVSDVPNASGCYPVQLESGAECTACSLCATVCPDAAIEVFRD